MRRETALVILAAVCAAFLALAGCEARQESADAESARAVETALASNEGAADAHADCAHSRPKEECGETCSCGGDCIKPLSADAGETETADAEVAMATAEEGGCPYMEKGSETCAKTGTPCGGAMKAEMDAVTDLVCGMTVGADSEFSAEHGEATHYFCSGNCRDQFTSEPGKYVQ